LRVIHGRDAVPLRQTAPLPIRSIRFEFASKLAFVSF
jgi:hypothetical protein